MWVQSLKRKLNAILTVPFLLISIAAVSGPVCVNRRWPRNRASRELPKPAHRHRVCGHESASRTNSVMPPEFSFFQQLTGKQVAGRPARGRKTRASWGGCCPKTAQRWASLPRRWGQAPKNFLHGGTRGPCVRRMLELKFPFLFFSSWHVGCSLRPRRRLALRQTPADEVRRGAKTALRTAHRRL
jgi:hypothetical protein